MHLVFEVDYLPQPVLHLNLKKRFTFKSFFNAESYETIVGFVILIRTIESLCAITESICICAKNKPGDNIKSLKKIPVST